ncbi:glucan biosynthesis protein D [Cupriavidus basilensis OR16]|uniref:Glucan biosynthesis protein D n=1 Tax=Cupriavidus basilensis OR16 TaxID=1127483 RepID=H1RYL6_9BURK|nr:glucan biosynthesis protein D [Cupriavidus basilensis OR16]
MMNRRTLLVCTTASAALAALGITPTVLAAGKIKLGDARPFSFDALIERARTLAGRPYAPPATAPAEVLAKIDYEAHGKISFKADEALFVDGPGQFPVTFFHLGNFFRQPVRMHVIDSAKGAPAAREIVYDGAYFEMPADRNGRRTIGRRSWAPHISAPSASFTSTVCPRAALPST